MVLSSSCQKMLRTYIPLYYNISNETDYKLTVFYTYVPHGAGQEYDTIIRIAKGQKRTLLVQLNSYQYLDNPETEDTLALISSIHIYNSDSVESKTDFLLTKYWTYKEYPSKSDLDLKINHSDF